MNNALLNTSVVRRPSLPVSARTLLSVLCPSSFLELGNKKDDIFPDWLPLNSSPPTHSQKQSPVPMR